MHLQAHRVIRPGRTESAELATALDALAAAVRGRRLVVLFGAGVSAEYPSLLPLAMDGQLPGLRSTLLALLTRHQDEPFRSKALGALGGASLEHLLDSCARILGERAFGFLDLLANDGARPNFRHLALALLARAGYCRTFATVNFDSLFEGACAALGVAVVVPEATPREENTYRSLGNRGERADRPCVLLKLHGTLSQKENLLTTVERVATGLPPFKKGVFQAWCRERPLLVLGYSNNDLDVFPALREVSACRCVFWYELSEPPIRGAVAAFLSQRANYVFTGSLSALLRDTLSSTGLGDTQILQLLGVSQLSAIEDLESHAIPERRRAITEAADHFAAAALPKAAAALILATLLPVEQGAEREQLFSSVECESLPQWLECRYRFELAERYHNVGSLTAAMRERRRALRQLRHAGYTRRETTRLVEEHLIRLGGEYKGLFKRARRPGYLLAALWLFFLAVIRLGFRRSSLRALDRGPLRAMIYHHCGDFLQFLLEARLLSALRRHTERAKPRRPAAVGAVGRVLAGLAAAFYRRGLAVSDQGAGFRLLVTQRLAEVLMHAGGRVPGEAASLLDRARRHARTPTDRAPGDELGPHEGLRLYYEGRVSDAIDSFTKTLSYYEATHHRTGKAKVLLYRAMAHGAAGNLGELRHDLAAFDKTNAGYS